LLGIANRNEILGFLKAKEFFTSLGGPYPWSCMLGQARISTFSSRKWFIASIVVMQFIFVPVGVMVKLLIEVCVGIMI
jgi:hypothetical protein